MANSSPVRRSGRQRQINRRYSFDPFEELDIASSDSDHDGMLTRQLIDEGKDSQLITHVADVPDLNNMPVEDGSEVVTPDEESMDESLDDSDVSYDTAGDLNSKPKRSLTQKAIRWRLRKERTRHEHFRGLMNHEKHTHGKETILKQLFGPDPKDWVHVLRSRDQWLNNPSLPKRTANENGVGGMCYLFSHTEEKRKMEAGVGWDWYYDQGGRELFNEMQNLRVLTSDEGIAYIPKSSKLKHRFLLGPYGKQKVFDLAAGQNLCLDEGLDSPGEAELRKNQVKRDGWILNVGTAVRCLDWTTNQDDIQYLAIATSRPKHVTLELSKVSPAYTPSPPIQSSIQIWEFAAGHSYHDFLDSQRPPKLRLVICTEWGDVKQAKWCPMPRIFREGDSHGKVSLGLMAGIWTDGHVRVLDVQLDNDGSMSYVKYNNAAFTARPPNTLCTCITWLSATDIAVGCANGFLAIWDITTNPKQGPNSKLTPTPRLYIQLHQSYILALASAYPTHPNFLASSSMDGYLRLTDLCAPATDFVLSTRSRMNVASLAFSEPLVSFISTEETNHVRIYSLRSFFTSISFARPNAFPLALSVGHFHPTVLVGCADGSLVAANPMRRALYRKAQQYQQVVFRHEWTRQGGGVSRWTDGYKVGSVKVQRTEREAQDGMLLSTVFETEEAISQVVWNPNLRCGGWVAAGTGSGLVRVQDLAV